MKELVGKLTALDPEVRETLAVITYFDTLMDGRVSVETLVRGAATLSGVTAGYRRGAEVLRVLADGRRGENANSTAYESHSVGPHAVVWIERDGPPHTNDAMIRERLAIAIALSARTGRAAESQVRRALEQLLDSPLDDRERLAATARLRLDPSAAVRAIALPSGAALPAEFPTAILATHWGLVRGGIIRADDEPSIPRSGIGIAGPIGALSASWRTAAIALLLSDDEHPVFRAEDLGLLLPLTESIGGQSDMSPDVATIDRLIHTSWSQDALQAIADGESIRAVASAAGFHHSSIHAKLPELSRALGYDPLTPLGRTRMYTALLLRRLTRARFDRPLESREIDKTVNR